MKITLYIFKMQTINGVFFWINLKKRLIIFDFWHLVFFEVLFIKAKFENPFAGLEKKGLLVTANIGHSPKSSQGLIF